MSRFSESISSISAIDKSRQTRIFENSDFYNGNQATKNVSLAPPIVNSSDYVVKHGNNALHEYKAFTGSYQQSPGKQSPTKLTRHISQAVLGSALKNFETFAPNSQ
jgi:hypothetical protein